MQGAARLFFFLNGGGRVWISRYSEGGKPDLLLLQDLACVLGSLIDDKAHLWPEGLEVRRYSVMCQFLRSGRTDGNDDKGTQPSAQLIAETHPKLPALATAIDNEGRQAPAIGACRIGRRMPGAPVNASAGAQGDE